MSSLLSVRLGAQRPTWAHLPPNVADAPAADEAIELAASAGLLLDDWQQWVLRGMLGERVDGRWAAPRCTLVVPRQNGKNAILEAIELAAVFLWGVKLVVHSAHKFDTSQEHYQRLKWLIQGADHLMDHMPATRNRGFTEANGKESIRLANGNRIKFLARRGGSGRGFSGDLIVFDEAQDLDDTALGSMVPTLSARTMVDETAGVQMMFVGSPPKNYSTVLHELCRQGRNAPADEQMFFAQWGNEPGASLDDSEALARANPGLNIRISEEFVATQERPVLSDAEYARERLGIPEAPDMLGSVFPPGAWSVLEDPQSRPETEMRLAIDVHPDLLWSSIGGAARRADGLDEVVLLDRRAGTRWVVDAAVELQQRHGVPYRIDPRSAAGGLIQDLEAAGVTLEQIKTIDLTQSCAAFQRAVIDRTLRHRGQAPLDAAVAGAAVRTVGEAWAWARLSSAVDISPLVAVTIAYGAKANEESDAFWL